jgi:glyoxylase-like metal-dependent hydrolase (beta-lactamase superfamily II)
VVNFYVVEGPGGLTVVDAGAPRDWDALLAELATIGAAPGDVRAILLTHAHPDHSGFAERARTQAGATVWVHDEDVAVAKGAKPAKNDGTVTAYLFRSAFYRTAFSLLRRGAGKIIPILEVSGFRDGETVEVPGAPRVVHAPGHTPGSCALFVKDRRALLTGDVLVTWNPLTGRRGPQIMPSGLNRDTPQAFASLTAIEVVDADILLPGHGDPWTGGVGEAIRAARAAGRS